MPRLQRDLVVWRMQIEPVASEAEADHQPFARPPFLQTVGLRAEYSLIKLHRAFDVGHRHRDMIDFDFHENLPHSRCWRNVSSMATEGISDGASALKKAPASASGASLRNHTARRYALPRKDGFRYTMRARAAKRRLRSCPALCSRSATCSSIARRYAVPLTCRFGSVCP